MFLQKFKFIGYPCGITSLGNYIVVSDLYNNRINILSPDGETIHFEGEFDGVESLICDHNGNIAVCDSGNNRIQVFNLKIPLVSSIDLQSKVEFLFSFGEQMIMPSGITCDHNGNYIVSDTGNHRIQVYSPKGEFIFSFGNEGIEEGQFSSPDGLTCDHNGNIAICDSDNHRIQVFKLGTSSMSTIDLQSKCDVKFLFAFGKKGGGEGEFLYPKTITCDHEGNYVVVDEYNHRIQVFTNKGEFIRSFGNYGKEEGQFRYPSGIICNNNGDYVVCDSTNQRIQVFKGPSEVPSLVSMCWKKINTIQ
jgi:tripartite motif-containing protein 71